ncbi:MAG TPA: hypothetical protein VNO32_65015 [Candidatus Acidoferrum sp.]|jgi:hypothetical protein|nr:hypothetical protein [Candidatus Acidoferrum sp.]
MIENNWWELYRAAVLEIDRNKLRDRVLAAEDAIRARASLGGLVPSEERISLQDAMGALLVLRRELGHSRVDNKFK